MLRSRSPGRRRATDVPALRVGLHVGPVVERDDDYFGATVNIAARVAASLASARSCARSASPFSPAADHGLAAARPMGTVRLKNVAAPVTLYELNANEVANELRHIDPVCRMQVVPGEAPAQTKHEGATLYFCSLSCAVKFKEAPETHLPLAPDKPGP